jgi:diguanylate cyclase (GGDEF)-like protein
MVKINTMDYTKEKNIFGIKKGKKGWNLSVHNRKGAFYSVPLKRSLRLRLTFIYVVGMILLGAIVLGVVYNVLDRRVEAEYIAKGNAVASTVARMVNGETVDRYLSALETDAEYETMLSHLRTMQTEHGLLYVCVIRMLKDGEMLVFGTGEPEEGIPTLGKLISWVDSFGGGHDDYINALLRGESVGPLVSNGVYGHILSTYVPIYRDDKSVAAYACVDISMDQLKQEETVRYILTSIGVMSVLILTITTSLFILRRYILSPINILLDQAASVNVVGSNSAKETPLQARLRFGDEMAVLERAIIDMELRIRSEVAVRLQTEENYRTEMKQAQLEAEYYAKAANTLSNTALMLLSQKEETFEYTMMNGIGLIADMMDLDRVTVWRNTMKPDGLYGGQVFRWDRNDGGATPTTVKFNEIKVSEWTPRWEKVLSAGETINGPARLLPEAALLLSFGCVSVFITPIFSKKEFLGYVMFEDRNRERIFTEGEVDILQTVSLMISNLHKINEMTENIMYFKTEAEKIYIDPLTDIYNRRYLDENLKRVISTLSRSGAALSLMMIDIDYFKKYNDVYGHAKGDDCLKMVAAALKKSITRIDDFVVRYGGEEFTVVLPNTGEKGAHLIADRMLNNIRNLEIPHDISDVAEYVTISIGVVSGIVKHTYSADYWLSQADKMLYKSKQEGRNRYTFKAVDDNS